MKRFLLAIAVFICGAVLMVVELVGSRVLAPYLGNSIFVWTNLIGIILGSLSLGYWLGGKLADQGPKIKYLGLIILLSGLFVFFIPVIDDTLLMWISGISKDKTAATFASLILFAPPSVLLGMVSPYAVKLKLENLNSAGKSVGNLYAISTLGSIVGTFLTGYYLLSTFGNQTVLVLCSFVLVLLAIILLSGKVWPTLIILILIIVSNPAHYDLKIDGVLADIDSPYNRILIFDTTTEANEAIRVLETSALEAQSAIFKDKEGLVFEYAKGYRLADHFNKNIKDALMIGGAGYTFPQDFLKNHPDSKMDVVEIDSTMTKVAKEYFNLKDNPNLATYNEDARTFLKRSGNKYDVVFMDAYRNSESIPFYLTTEETVRDIKKVTKPEGVVLLNTISALEGDKGKFIRAEYATYKKVFNQVFVLPLDPDKPAEVQNILIIALNYDTKPSFLSSNKENQNFLNKILKKPILEDLPVLTDDFAPVDQYLLGLQ